MAVIIHLTWYFEIVYLAQGREAGIFAVVGPDGLTQNLRPLACTASITAGKAARVL
jgi:hypothetical protein